MEHIGKSVERVMQELAQRAKCQQDSHPTAYLARRVKRDGQLEIVDWCDRCQRVVTAERTFPRRTSYTKQWVADQGIAIDALPEVSDTLRYRHCYRCSRYAPCQDHHAVLRELYGKEADEFPVVPVCGDCHDHWTRLTRSKLRHLAWRYTKRWAKWWGPDIRLWFNGDAIKNPEGGDDVR